MIDFQFVKNSKGNHTQIEYNLPSCIDYIKIVNTQNKTMMEINGIELFSFDLGQKFDILINKDPVIMHKTYGQFYDQLKAINGMKNIDQITACSNEIIEELSLLKKTKSKYISDSELNTLLHIASFIPSSKRIKR